MSAIGHGRTSSEEKAAGRIKGELQRTGNAIVCQIELKICAVIRYKTNIHNRYDFTIKRHWGVHGVRNCIAI